MAKKCRYQNCVRLASNKHDDCSACRGRHRYWFNKPAVYRLERRRKLSLSGETMREFVTDTKLKAAIRKGYNKEKKAAE